MVEQLVNFETGLNPVSKFSRPKREPIWSTFGPFWGKT